MGFQKQVNQQPAPAEAGDFASANPRASVPVGGPGFRVGTDALIVGRFAWGNPTTLKAESNAANGGILGFVHRENQTVITEFLGEQRVAVQAGFPVTLMSQGDYWADVGAAGCDFGEPVYANDTTGVAQQSASGGTLTQFVFASSVPVPAVSTASATIAAQTGVLTIGAVASGVFEVGQKLTWSGKNANAQAVITAQLTGTPGGAGTYATTYVDRAAVTTTTVTATAGTLAKISTWAQATP